GERIDHYLTRRRAKDGRVLSISLTVSPIRDAGGTIVGASHIARDVTQQQKYQQTSEQDTQLFRRSDADLDVFACSASHDLQEPLRMASAYGEMLQRKFGGRLGEQGDEYIHYIVEGATRMERLLQDLRAFTRASRVSDRPSGSISALEV